jgi:hypothetical protein
VTGLDDDGEDAEADLMGSFRTNCNRGTHLTTTALLQLTSDVIKIRMSPQQPETFRTAWIVMDHQANPHGSRKVQDQTINPVHRRVPH